MVNCGFGRRCIGLCLVSALFLFAGEFSKAGAAGQDMLRALESLTVAPSGEPTAPKPPSPPAPPAPPAPSVPQPARPTVPQPVPAQPGKPGKATPPNQLKPNANTQPMPQQQPGTYSTGHLGIPSVIDGFWFSVSPKGAVTLGLKNGVFMLMSASRQFNGQGTFQIQGRQIFISNADGQKQTYDFQYDGQNLILRDTQGGLVMIYQRISGANIQEGVGLIP